ncbi:winged helix-turn-helix domain-containing protein [Halolamina salifodinae]|uniref:Putative ArsR family transcriptional regulator n=1 Tax=Halolamina salifodinae TaxID=1202767 RepID=A0A8T4GRJ6_9EURY|nr:winged helix-turn-helix domain-containing protein [Halolamina salifodinae]MBP1985761.1 putative ArsR family transcriptional regulator [Halolamina salifodinae]
MASAATLLDLLGGELDRQILELTDERPRSAEEVAERCEASLPTVYRHVDDLVSAGLLVERTQYDDDGNHYKTYVTTLLEATVRLDDGELTVELVTEGTADAAEESPTPDGVSVAGSGPADDIERPGSEG